MNKIVKLAAVASIVAISSSASAFWGNGSNMGDMANDFFGDAFGDGTGDFNMNMNASGRGNGRGQGRGYDRFAYQGYGNPYAYGPYGAPYGYGACTDGTGRSSGSGCPVSTVSFLRTGGHGWPKKDRRTLFAGLFVVYSQ